MSKFGSPYHKNRAAGKIPLSPKAIAKMVANGNAPKPRKQKRKSHRRGKNP